MSDQSTRDWYSVTEAAEHLGVSPKTIRRHIDSGQLPAYRVGGKVIRIHRKDLALLLTPHESTTSTSIGVIFV